MTERTKDTTAVQQEQALPGDRPTPSTEDGCAIEVQDLVKRYPKTETVS